MIYTSFTTSNLKIDQTGTTLIETVISIGVIGLLTLGALQLYTRHNNSSNYLKIEGELEDTRNYIRSALNCSATISGQTADCDAAGGSSINLKRSNGSIFIAKYANTSEAGSTLGANIELKASCKEDGGFYRINVDYRRRSGNQLLSDPLKGTTKDWAPLTKNVPLVCPKAKNPLGPCLYTVDNLCPTNYAVFSILDSYGSPALPSNQVPLLAQCCPVPPGLVENGSDTWEDSDCNPSNPSIPDGKGRVLTGAKFFPAVPPAAAYRKLRCTSVNSARFQIDTPKMTKFYYAAGSGPSSGWGSAPMVVESITTPLADALSLPERFNYFKKENSTQDAFAIPPYNTLSPSLNYAKATISTCAYPGGSGIIVSRTTKYCSDARAVRIKDWANLPVQLVPSGCSGSVTNAVTAAGRTVTVNDVNCSSVPAHWKIGGDQTIAD